jgi:hypothetical protein
MDTKVTALPRPGKYPENFPQNLRPRSLFSTTGKLFDGIVIAQLKRDGTLLTR